MVNSPRDLASIGHGGDAGDIVPCGAEIHQLPRRRAGEGLGVALLRHHGAEGRQQGVELPPVLYVTLTHKAVTSSILAYQSEMARFSEGLLISKASPTRNSSAVSSLKETLGVMVPPF